MKQQAASAMATTLQQVKHMARALPDWPRMMTRDMAAPYCGLSEAAFEREVAAMKLPMPTRNLGAKPLWSKLVLDEYLARIDGTGSGDWRKEQPLYQGKAA